MRRPFTTIAGLILGIVAIAQATRAALGVEVVIDGYQVPVMASWIAAVVAGIVSLMAFREARH
jgi:hypothetical protein